MIKIVIVEDEDIIRKGLIYTINWTALDCIIIGEAENGKQGEQIILEQKPDLVITDIKMPYVDGLAMLRNTKSKLDFETIIISSYSEFNFAKQAIELDVVDYILKPIDENILRETIEKIKIKIQEKKAFLNYKNHSIENKETDFFNIKYFLNEEKFKMKYIYESISYISEYYKLKISIEDIASKLNISTSYLSRKFKKITAHTFNDFLNRYRIQKSLELLSTGEYKVYEVADMVGFNEYKYFSYVFKQYMNCSPLEFLKGNYTFKGE